MNKTEKEILKTIDRLDSSMELFKLLLKNAKL